jgi:pimeloyl-ACP methyl ester carboxylesterase
MPPSCSSTDTGQGSLNSVTAAAKDMFYNRLPEDEAEQYFQLLLTHSMGAFKTTVNFIPVDITTKKTYIVCEKDKALPAEFQKQLIEQTPGFRVETMNSGHSPFLTQPNECAELIRQVVEVA